MKEGSFIPAESRPQLSPEQIRERLKDPHYLPSYNEVERAFPKVGNRASSPEWGELLFNPENPIFELLNEEYLNALSDYVIDRIHGLRMSQEPVVILEVGAGNGRLAHFLNQKLQERAAGAVEIKVIATDSGSWDIPPIFPTEQIGQKEALEKYEPKLVISSWMPMDVDWTADFRSVQSVEEYLLIGESDGGCTGHQWDTWGCAWGLYEEDGYTEKKREGEVAPYVSDGFERVDLEDMARYQIGRGDQPGDYHHSSTVSFRRNFE